MTFGGIRLSGSGAAKSGVFISYRHADSEASARKLYERLHAELAPRPIFMDAVTIRLGENFEAVLDQALDGSLVLLAVIGKQWLTIAGPGGPRLHDPSDWVHREITTALNYDIPVIPVLVDGARMPDRDALPVNLVSMGPHHAHTLIEAEDGDLNVQPIIDRVFELEREDQGRARARLNQARRADIARPSDTYQLGELYQPRQVAEEVFQAFVEEDDARALLYIGRAGDGKTVTLARLYEQTLSAGAFAGWYQAAEWHEPGDLERALAEQLPPAGDNSFPARLRAFNRVLDRAVIEHPSVLFIDGVNESGDPAVFVEELTDLLDLLAHVPALRVVASCRAETFSRYHFEGRQYWTPALGRTRSIACGQTQTRVYSGALRGRTPDWFAVHLGEFTPEQLAEMWRAYARAYKTKPEEFAKLPEQARKLATHNPLMLRLVAEAFQTQEVPQGVSSLVVFRAYFDYFVEGDPERQAQPTSEGERDLLETLVGILANLEQGTVLRRAPRDTLQKEADRLSIPWAAYDTLVRKGVLLELEVIRPGSLAPIRYVGFAFERMFEFALAVRLHGMGYEARGDDLERLLQQGLDSAALWGAARTLILLELEQRARLVPQVDAVSGQDAAVWLSDLLASSGSGVRGLVTDALIQLGQEDRDLIEWLARRLLATPNAVAEHVAVAIAVQLRLSDVLLDGCSLSDRAARRRAAHGAIYLWQQDHARGVELWERLCAKAALEVGRNLGGWAAIIGSVAKIVPTSRQAYTIEEIRERIELRVPTFVALLQVCFVSYAISGGKSEVIRPLQEGLRRIVAKHLNGVHGRFLNWLTRTACGHIYTGAMRAAGLYSLLDEELQVLRRDGDLRRACLRLVRSWDDGATKLSSVELARTLRLAARGGALASFAIQGALMARLRHDPDDAIDLVFSLADSDDDRISRQGLTAAGVLVLSAMAVAERPTEQEWFKRLADELETRARQTFPKYATPLNQRGVPVPPLDLQHVFLARQLTIERLIPLVEELRASAQRDQYCEGEVEVIRGLGGLFRLGYPEVALDALTLWGDVRDGPDEYQRTVFDTVADALAEMLAAFPDSLEGWLERARNPALEARVREKLLEIDPELLVFRYGPYMMIFLACKPDSARALSPALVKIFRPAPNLEEAVKILGEVLFDLKNSPFLY